MMIGLTTPRCRSLLFGVALMLAGLIDIIGMSVLLHNDGPQWQSVLILLCGIGMLFSSFFYLMNRVAEAAEGLPQGPPQGAYRLYE